MDKDSFKSVFISDVHLGTKGCKAKKLHEFLGSFDAENLFLVGDIIDGWALQRRHYWTKKQTEVIRRVLKMSEKMNVVFIAGNHDEFIRPFFKYDFQFGRIEIADNFIYTGVDNRTYYVTHGDYFDLTMKIPRWVFSTVGHIMDRLPYVDHNTSFTDKMFDIFGTEKVIRKYISKKEYDCAITGHTHNPMIKEDYMNCGDWVTNCTALVEHYDGTWELKYYGRPSHETEEAMVEAVES